MKVKSEDILKPGEVLKNAIMISWWKLLIWVIRHNGRKGTFKLSIYDFNPKYKIIKFQMQNQNFKLYQAYEDSGLSLILLHIETSKWKEIHSLKELKSLLKKIIYD